MSWWITSVREVRSILAELWRCGEHTAEAERVYRDLRAAAGAGGDRRPAVQRDVRGEPAGATGPGPAG